MVVTKLFGRGVRTALVCLLVFGGIGLLGQTPTQNQGQNQAQAQNQNQDPKPAATSDSPQSSLPPPSPEPIERHGKVLFQSHGEPPNVSGEPLNIPKRASAETQPNFTVDAVPDLSDREREAFTVSSYDLDVRLQPATAGLVVRAHLTLRNDGAESLRRVPLQVSSTLRWEAATQLASAGAGTPLPLVQHTLDTDADHTGKASEAILTLKEALAPGASVVLDVLYSGTLAPSTGRLQRIGVTAEQAAGVDWDGVREGESGGATAIRGFGNVLWYPVISPQLFLGSGNDLFLAAGAMRKREQTATVKLHVTTDYTGEPPAAVYFCGRRKAFKSLSDANDAPVASGSGITVAEFEAAPIGFRTLSLFVLESPEVLMASLPSGAAAAESAPAEPAFSSSAGASGAGQAASVDSGRPVGAAALSTFPAGGPAAPGPAVNDPMLAVETADEGALPALAASARRVAPLLMQWFGARPLSTLTVLDAEGQPFQDGAVLRAPVATLGTSGAAGVLVHSLTAAWVQTGQPWMDEGLAEFMELLWTEQTTGRPAALAQLGEMMTPVRLAEPVLERPAVLEPGGAVARGSAGTSPGITTSAEKPSGSIAEPLVSSQSELFYRRKAAAVWWMLRDLAGEDALRQALGAWRLQPASGRDSPAEASAFQKLLERTSGKELGWFFDDWVLRDRGLPDLTLAEVTPRQLPAGQGHDSGWLVAVTVRNDGAAVADVPLVVRSGSYSVTRRLRVPGFAVVTDRVLVESAPTEVVLNDGSTPEVRASVHSRSIVVHGS